MGKQLRDMRKKYIDNYSCKHLNLTKKSNCIYVITIKQELIEEEEVANVSASESADPEYLSSSPAATSFKFSVITE